MTIVILVIGIIGVHLIHRALERHRDKQVMHLYNEDKITAEQGAFLNQVSRDDFLKSVREWRRNK